MACNYTGCGPMRVEIDRSGRRLVTREYDGCLVQHSITASREAALEDALFVTVSIKRRARATVKRAIGRAARNIAIVDRT